MQVIVYVFYSICLAWLLILGGLSIYKFFKKRKENKQTEKELKKDDEQEREKTTK